jgi:hypothetical protein
MTRLLGRLSLLGALAILSACQMTAPGPGVGQAVAPPRHFIADSLGPACLTDARGAGRSAAAARRALAALHDNHMQYIADLRRSTSLTVEKDAFAANWKPVLFNSYAAAAAQDPALARTIIDGLVRLAQSGRYLDEPNLLSWQQARSLPACYEAGPSAPCPTHTPRFVTRMYANLMISAAVLDPYLTDADRAALRPWFDAAYRKFVRVDATGNQHGIYDFGNMGMARLAYAQITGDMGIARNELSFRRGDFLKRIEPSGYIDQNSFRGVRGFWYHTYGLDPALSYALLARAWGVDFFADPALGPRLRAAVAKTDLGVRDYAAFRAVGNRGDAYSTNPADTRDFVHQYALNLYMIADREFGIVLPRSPMHDRLARLESFTQISGFSAGCYYSSR